MKILHIINSVNPAGGGPIEGVRQLGTCNHSRGHQVEVVSLDPPGAEYLASCPFPVYAVGPGKLKYAYSPRLAPWLRENMSRYDIAIVNGVWQYHSLAAWQVLHNSILPYVVFTHGMLDPWFNQRYPLKRLKKMLYWPWAEYRVLRDAKAVLFTCEEERLLARKSFRPYRCNEVVVRYGTAGSKGDPQTESQAFFAQYPQLRGKRIAIFVGRLHEKKGCDLLIEAFARVLAADPDWHLVLAGPDQMGWQPRLKELAERLNISERITWTGMISGDLKWGAIRAAEIFVLPSHQENFGIVVAEALSCSTPALISNRVNIWREVHDGGAGLVGTDDLEGTCAVLKTWLNMTAEEKSTMRNQAHACFLRNFEIEGAASTLISTLSRFMTGECKKHAAAQ